MSRDHDIGGGARQVDIGIALPNASVPTGAIDAGEFREVAVMLDAARAVDTLWIGDSLLTAPRLEALTTLGVCAGLTRRIRLGVGCLASAALRDPILLAAQWSTLCTMSEGRAILVACTGPTGSFVAERELEAYGLAAPAKIARVVAAIEAVRNALCGDKINVSAARLDGTGMHDVNVDLGLPVAYPAPIWIAANPSPGASRRVVEGSLRRVASVADGWMTFATTGALLVERIDLLRTFLAESGRGSEPFPVNVFVDVRVDRDMASARTAAEEYWAHDGRSSTEIDHLARQAVLGSAEHCRDAIRAILAAGATGVTLRPVGTDLRVQAHVLAEEVAPELAAP